MAYRDQLAAIGAFGRKVGLPRPAGAARTVVPLTAGPAQTPQTEGRGRREWPDFRFSSFLVPLLGYGSSFCSSDLTMAIIFIEG